jgi:hypothetical protein
MAEFSFSSRLPLAYREDLENLLFFHPHQETVSPGIVRSVERFGTPAIVVHGDFLRIHVGELSEVQALYATVEGSEKPALAGVAIYTRTDVETIDLLHIAIHEEYSSSGKHSGEMLAMKMVSKLCEIARQIKGVRYLGIVYGRGDVQKILVRSRE